MFNVMVGSAIVSSIFSLLRLPARDGDWQVVNLWSIGCSVSQSMLEEMLIVAFRKVSPRMGPTRLSSQKGRIGHRLGYVKHEIKLERAHDFCVEGAATILNDDVLKSFSKSSQGLASLLHLFFITIDAGAFLHRLLHFLANSCDSFLAAVLAQELTIKSPLFVRSQRVDRRRRRRLNGAGISSCSATCASSEYQQLR